MQETLTTQHDEAVVTAPPARSPRPKRVPKRPTVETFQEIVMRHCKRWQVVSVDSLCGPQTEELITELAQHFG